MPATAAAAADASPARLTALLAGLIVVVAATFYAAPGLEFTTWDDQVNVTLNPFIRQFSAENLRRFWGQGYAGLYAPVTYTFYMLETTLAEEESGGDLAITPRLDPTVYHVGNVVLHALTALFVFLILRILVGNDFAAAAGAVLFAVHPLQVESVAWVSETKGLLAGFFGTFALWQYLGFSRQFEEGRSVAWLSYAVATAAAVLAMLSKPSAVALPLVAAALDWGIMRRSKLRILLAVLPWLAVAAWVVWISRSLQARVTESLSVDLLDRPLLALDALAFYLLKLVVPLGLCTDYGRTPSEVMQGDWWWVTIVFPLGVLYFLASLRDRRIWLTAAAVFILALLPMLGFLTFEFQRFSTVADRYAYLALLGPALALAWFLAHAQGRGAWAVVAVGLLALAAFSSQQTRIWYDDRSLFEFTKQVNPKSYVAYTKLGAGYFKEGDPKRAIDNWKKALELRPDDVKAVYGLALALYADSQYRAAEPLFRDVLAQRPADANPYAMAGQCYLRMRDPDAAEFEFNRALAINKNNEIALAGLIQARELRAALQAEKQRQPPP